MPIGSKDVLLVHLPAPPPKGWHDAVAKRFPQLQVRWEQATFDRENSSIFTADSLPKEVLDGVTMMCLYPPPQPQNMKDVRFMQLISAGSDLWTDHPVYLDKDVQFCSGSGCQPPQIAEWVIATWLAHQHHFDTYAEQQKQGIFLSRVLDRPVTDSTGRRMGIFGYGAIGRQCAHLARALGMEVYAYTARERDTPESRRHEGYIVPGTSDPDGTIPTKWFSGDPRTAINEFLAQDLDILVLSVPLNESTRALIGHEQFKLMSKQRTFLCNVARGPIVDTDALIQAAETGQIRGAALDVTDPEPLPKDHPLWKAPNVFITPHISWNSTAVGERVSWLLYENLERLDRGEPLINAIRR